METKDTNLILNQITEQLKLQFQPKRLYLYGSRAQGTARPDSDYDFVMVISHFNSADRFKVMDEVGQQFHKDFGIQVQVWVYNEDEFNARRVDFGSIPETAANTGREIEL
ncbi:MAG: nucleotidyltransferase domain-containing protein [Pseudobdellovibrionaceae bacterium]